MTQLKTEVDEAWKMVDSARANESRLKDESEALRVSELDTFTTHV
jgi:hypothetical protein